MSIFDPSFEVKQSGGSFLRIDVDQPIKLRIIGKAFVCNSAWDDDNKPHRWPLAETKAGNWKDPAKVEVNVPVFIHGESEIKVWSITQKGVQKTLQDLDKDPDFELTDVDLKVSKTGHGLDTRWSVQTLPVPQNLTAEQTVMIKNAKPNWDEYVNGGDPFVINDDLPF